MNPFDFRGPEFLAFWLMGAMCVAVVTAIVRARLARVPSPDDPAAVAKRLAPTDLAYLAGGHARAVEAAIVGLRHRGAIAIDDDRLIAGDRASGPDAPTEIEARVLAQLPAHAREVARDRGAEPTLRARLEREHLLADQARAWILAPGLVWLGVGATKVAIGVGRDRPVGFLLLLLIGGAIALALLARPARRSSFGDEVLDASRRRNGALELTAQTAPAQLDGDEMTLAFALYAGGWVDAPLRALLPSLSGGGGGDGGSCGGGCGGGSCGGGCGGCGGH